MKLHSIKNVGIILVVGLVTTLSLVHFSYSGSFGRIVAIAGGKILLEFVGGFANKMGQEAAGRLVKQYPLPSPRQKTGFHKNSPGGYLSYEFIEWRGNSRVYKVRASDEFVQNLRLFDNKFNELLRDLEQRQLVTPKQRRELWLP